MPSGMPATVAMATEPKARAMWVRPSAQKAGARVAYSLRIERSFHAPLHSRPTMAIATTTRMAMRISGAKRRRASASVTSRAKAKLSNQKPAPGETRANVSPSGVRWLADQPTPTKRPASAMKPAASLAATGKRNRAMAKPINRMPTSRIVGVGGSASSSATGSPGTIRLARNRVKGSAAPAAAISAISTPSLSRASQAGLAVAAGASRMLMLACGSPGRRLEGWEPWPPPGFNLVQETALGQVVGRDGGGGFATDLDAAVELLQHFEGQAFKDGLEQFFDLGEFRQHFLADDRGGLIDRLHTLVVFEHLEPGRRNAAIGAIDHGGVDAIGLLGSGGNGGRGVATRQGDQLVRREREAIDFLELGKGRRRVHELGGGGELDFATT